MVRDGSTSMVINVEAWVTRQPSGDQNKVTEAKFVFVAVDENSVKRKLPDPET